MYLILVKCLLETPENLLEIIPADLLDTLFSHDSLSIFFFHLLRKRTHMDKRHSIFAGQAAFMSLN